MSFLYSKSSQTAVKKYNLSIDVYINEEFRQKLELSFDGKDSIGKVKSYTSVLLGTAANRQKWTGWPVNAYGDEVTLQSCGISDSTSLRVNVSLDQKTPKITSRPKAECGRTPTEASLNNSRIDEVVLLAARTRSLIAVLGRQ